MLWESDTVESPFKLNMSMLSRGDIENIFEQFINVTKKQ